jgi:hypothetical protein
MENRLSNVALIASLDAGHQSLPWDPGQPAGFLTAVDLKAIMQDPAAAEIIPSLPVQPLYYALKRQGLEESLEVLPLLSQEQVTRMIDYDAWSSDRLVPKKLFEFLKPFAEVSAAQLFERFSELDEEYQLAALEGKVRVYEAESIYDLSEDLQDRVRAMPCGKVFYEICTDDSIEIEFIDALIRASQEQNLRYTYSLLGHVSYLPPSEQEAMTAQFRRARMEEDGFVSFEESQDLFRPIDLEAVKGKWGQRHEVKPHTDLMAGELSFLDQVFLVAQESGTPIDDLYTIHQGFLYLANALCAASQVEPDDMQGLHRLLEQSKALSSLGLEYLADGQTELGRDILKGEAARVLFQVGYTRIDRLRTAVVEKLHRLRLPRAERLQDLYRGRHWGALILELDRHWVEYVGLESGEILKGLFNRFPMYPVQIQDEAKRIIFRPLFDEQSFRELELSVAGVLGLMAVVVKSGMPLQQSFELVLRERAIDTLARTARGAYVDLEEEIPHLLQDWRSELVSSREQWFVGREDNLEATLALIQSWIHDSLHGLVILPRSPRPTQEESWS